jgi:hypothetical protein
MTKILKSFAQLKKLIPSGVSAAVCLSLVFAAGCSNQSGLLPQQTPVTVTIAAPSSTTIAAGSTVTLNASVSTGSLVWEAYAFPGNPCTGVACGTLSAASGTSVQYTAPATTAGGSTEVVEIRATSSVNQTVFATIDLSVTPVSVTITSPSTSSVSIAAGGTLALTAAATTVNSSGATVSDPKGVTWSLAGSGCSGSGCGTLTGATTTSITYNAPTTASTTALSVAVTATSVTDPGESAQVAITIPPAVVITITPSGSTSIGDGASLGLSASTTNDPTNSGVTWSLTCTIGGTATTGANCGSLGNITPTSVVYVAPQVPAGAVVASVTATSNYTSSISNAELVYAPAAPVITITPPSSTTVDDNTSLTLNATVANDVNNDGVTWTLACTISGSAGSGTACGTISGATNSATGTPTASSVTYNAPPATPNAIAVTLTATSNDNTLVTAIQNLTVPVAPVITINTPAPNTSVSGGATQLVSATVTNDSNGKGVTWTLSCDTGSGAGTTGAACGTVTAPTNTATTSTVTASTFTYKAPTAPANPVNVTITATSNLLTTSTATLPLVVSGSNPVTVSVSPNTATVADGTTQALTATVTNDSANAGITWSLSCVTNGVATTGSTCGSLSVTSNPAAPFGTVYTAPSYPEYNLAVTVTAASNTADTVTSSAALSVAAAPALTVTVTPQPITPNTVYYAQSGVGLALTAVVNNDQATPGVTWSVAPASGSVCPPSGCGTFSAPVTTASTTVAGQTTTTDTYTPPAGLVSPLSVVLTATSNSETDVTSTLNVTAEAAISFSPTVLGYAYAGQSTPFTQTVTVTGGTPPYTSITASNLPSWVAVTPNLTAGTLTLTGTPPATGTFTSITGGSYATPTSLGTGTSLVALSATDSTPNQPLTGTASSPATVYNPNEGAGTVSPSNAMMTGSYAFYGTGFQDQTGSNQTAAGTAGYPHRLSIIGSLTADGGGNITGEIDLNRTSGLVSYKVTGSYNVQPNQLATITLLLPTTPITPVTLVAALGGLNGSNIATTGQFIEYDSNGTSGNRITGEMALQAPSVLSQSSSPVSGSYAFGMQGGTPGSLLTSTCEAAATCGPADGAGQLVLTSGAVTGTEDLAYGSVSDPQVSLTGSLSSSGATDASGRMTATIQAGDSTLPQWPKDYAIYAVNASTFYFMSIDPFASTTMLSGKAEQQNLSDIASTPMSGPFVLFGSVFGYEAIVSPATDSGGIGVVLGLTATSSSATAGTIGATISTNAGAFNGYKDTTTATAETNVTALTGINYSVTPASGRVVLSGGSFTPAAASNYFGSPVVYLVDTNQGFAVTTPVTTGTFPTGTLTLLPQTGTSTGLSAGNYTVSIYKSDTPTGTNQVGIFVVPSAVATGASTAITITGQGFASYNAENAENNAASSDLFDLDIAGTSSLKVATGGAVSLNIQPGGFEACNSGKGFMISPTSFACIPNGAGQAQQVFYGVQ